MFVALRVIMLTIAATAKLTVLKLLYALADPDSLIGEGATLPSFFLLYLPLPFPSPFLSPLPSLSFPLEQQIVLKYKAPPAGSGAEIEFGAF